MTVSKEEKMRILQEWRIEGLWWEGQISYRDADDIQKAVAKGTLVPVTAPEALYRVSDHVAREHRYLVPECLKLLDVVAVGWENEMNKRGWKREGQFLLVSSLTRPLSLQRELVASGYPTTSGSLHEHGRAFDISLAWFMQHNPQAVRALWYVLSSLRRQGFLNAIDEPELGVVHVGMSPKWSMHSSLATSLFSKPFLFNGAHYYAKSDHEGNVSPWQERRFNDADGTAVVISHRITPREYEGARSQVEWR